MKITALQTHFMALGLASVILVNFAHAAVIGFEAESGTLGLDFDPAQADSNALGGFYITTETDSTGTSPGTEARTASYTFNLADGTYDVYVRGYVGPANASDDSFFWANSFGDADPTVAGDWNQENGGTGAGFLGVSAETWAWSKVLGTITASSGGTVTWEIGAREDGFRMDAFAFATTGTDVGRDANGQSSILTDAVTGVPEPSTMALLLSIAAGCFVRRRR